MVKSTSTPANDQAFATQLTGSQRRALSRLQRLPQEPRQDLRWHYDLGRQLTELAHASAGYGTSWVRQIAGVLGLSGTWVYQHRAFAERYTAEAAAALQASGMGWGMVVVLMGVRDEDARQFLQRETLAQGWTLTRLRLEVRRSHRSRRPGGGRPPASPSGSRVKGVCGDWTS